MLDCEQSFEVFQASTDLRKAYSCNHCTARVARSALKWSSGTGFEEEQNYNDFLCAIQLLNNIDAEDFMGTFSSERMGDKGVDSNRSRFLWIAADFTLHLPTLCKHFFLCLHL